MSLLRPLRLPAGLLLLNFVGSTVAPRIVARLVLDNGAQFTDAENFMIGALTFISLALVELIVRIESLQATQRTERKAIEVRGRLDEDLLAIRAACDSASASSGSGSLLTRFCSEEIRTVRSKLEGVVAAKEVVVDERHLYLSDSVLAVLSPDDRVRVVHRFRHNDDLVAAHELEWLRKVDQRLRDGRLHQVRRLFVYDNEDECRSELSASLLAAHIRDRNYDCRLISSTHYQNLIKDHLVPAEVIDFGVYGDKCVFRAVEYGPVGLRGSYSVAHSEQERFARAFDACWESTAARKPDSKQLPPTPKSMRAWLIQAPLPQFQAPVPQLQPPP